MVTLHVSEAVQCALQLHRAGATEEAELLYMRILDAAPETLDALHYLAILRHQQKRLQEAATLMKRIIEIAPQNADAHNNLGNVYEGMGDDDTAMEYFRKAVALNPDHAAAHNNLGVILVEQGRPEEAVRWYRRAVQLAPESAEFHANLGNALRRSGDMNGAADAYLEATRLDPDHFNAWQGLARVLRLAGRLDEAVQVFDNLLRMRPGNPVFSYLRAACLGSDVPERAPEAYVRQIFNDIAESFDRHLADLEYRAPQLVAGALAALLPPPCGDLALLDAGCGTGLCGPLLKPYARQLVGVDLSEGMLKQAAQRTVYDDLYHGELTAYLAAQREEYDVIVSADTLCYFGELDGALRASAGALKGDGLLAFTVEDSKEEGGFRLASCGRYAHSKKYLEDALDRAGLVVKSFSAAVLRNEGKQPVAGHLVVAGRKR